MNHHVTWKGIRREDPDRPRPLADAILRLIWQRKRMSRAQIVREEKLSRSTVSEVVAELLPTRLIAEVGTGKSSGGRRPIILEFRDDAAVILGVEMGAAHVGVALTDLRGRVLAWHTRLHPVRTDPLGTRSLIGELCDICVEEAADGRPLLGIGIAVPSPVDPTKPDGGLSEVVLPDWDGRLGLEGLSARLGAPLMVDNDANLGALCEHWWGAGRGVDNLAYIKVATGIGCGFVIGGDIYRGATGVAGEIGHLAIAPQGKTCLCGLRGCLVTLVGTPALIERTTELLEADVAAAARGETAPAAVPNVETPSEAEPAAGTEMGAGTSPDAGPGTGPGTGPDTGPGTGPDAGPDAGPNAEASILKGRVLTIGDIEKAALDGDPVARRVVTEAAEHLGIAVAGLLNLMNPAMVVFGGDLAGLGEMVLGPIRETVRQRTLVSQVTAAELVTSRLGTQSIAVGAATMILKDALADGRLLSAGDRPTETDAKVPTS